MTAGVMSRFSTQNLKSALTIKKIYDSFSLMTRAQFWMATTLLLWSLAAGLHLLLAFGKEEDNLLEWSLEILVAFLFATGFGWHLHRFIILRKSEKKRGKLYPFVEEFRTPDL